MIDVDYDKKDPPMIEGTLYSNMNAFKIALASHAVKLSSIMTLKQVNQGGTGLAAQTKVRAASGGFMLQL
jgi:hypothetical protein